MQTIVTHKNAVHKMAKRTQPTHWLCILDPDDRIFITPRLEELTTLHCRFDDEIEPDHPRAPTKRDVERILSWGRQIPSSATVLINCAAGISRSTASALLLMVQETGDIEDSARKLVAQRPEACPNPVIAQYGDDLLGMRGELFKRSEQIAEARMSELYGL